MLHLIRRTPAAGRVLVAVGLLVLGAPWNVTDAKSRKNQPIVLTSRTGEIVTVYRSGPTAIPGAAEAAAEVADVDKALGAATLADPRQVSAATDMREAALYSLSEGIYLATQTSSGGFPRQKQGIIGSLTDAARSILMSPWKHDVVATRIEAVPAGPISYTSFAEFKRSGRANASYTAYQNGKSLPIRAYVFRVEYSSGPETRSCEKVVAVWEDPTRQSLDCRAVAKRR